MHALAKTQPASSTLWFDAHETRSRLMSRRDWIGRHSTLHQIQLFTTGLACMNREILITAALDAMMQRDGVCGISLSWVAAAMRVVMIATPTGRGLGSHLALDRSAVSTLQHV
jgi:hypothetical protein